MHSPRFSNQVMWFINLNACVLPRKSAGTRRLWQRRGGMNTEDGCTRQEKSEGTWGDEEPCNACIPSLLPWARHPSPTRQGEKGQGRTRRTNQFIVTKRRRRKVPNILSLARVLGLKLAIAETKTTYLEDNNHHHPGESTERRR